MPNPPLPVFPRSVVEIEFDSISLQDARWCISRRSNRWEQRQPFEREAEAAPTVHWPSSDRVNSIFATFPGRRAF